MVKEDSKRTFLSIDDLESLKDYDNEIKNI